MARRCQKRSAPPTDVGMPRKKPGGPGPPGGVVCRICSKIRAIEPIVEAGCDCAGLAHPMCMVNQAIVNAATYRGELRCGTCGNTFRNRAFAKLVLRRQLNRATYEAEKIPMYAALHPILTAESKHFDALAVCGKLYRAYEACGYSLTNPVRLLSTANHLALCYYRCKLVDQAATLFKWIASHSESSVAWHGAENMAMIAEWAGHYSEAVIMLRRALSFSTLNSLERARVELKLARVYTTQGFSPDALMALALEADSAAWAHLHPTLHDPAAYYVDVAARQIQAYNSTLDLFGSE